MQGFYHKEVFMFVILKDKTICLTRGDIASIIVSANLQDGAAYTFMPGDVVRFTVCKMRDYSTIILQKEITISEESTTVTISLLSEDTRIGGVINKPVDYFILNPSLRHTHLSEEGGACVKLSLSFYKSKRLLLFLGYIIMLT